MRARIRCVLAGQTLQDPRRSFWLPSRDRRARGARAARPSGTPLAMTRARGAPMSTRAVPGRMPFQGETEHEARTDRVGGVTGPGVAPIGRNLLVPGLARWPADAGQ